MTERRSAMATQTPVPEQQPKLDFQDTRATLAKLPSSSADLAPPVLNLAACERHRVRVKVVIDF